MIMQGEIHERINKLMMQNASLESNLGLDSTDDERLNIKILQEDLYAQIKLLDLDYYDLITANKGQRRSPEVVAWLVGKNIL